MPTYAVRAPLARWLARGGGARRRRPRAVPAARRRAAARSPTQRSSRRHVVRRRHRPGTTRRRHARGDRGDPGRGRVVRRRPLHPGARARRRPRPGRPRARTASHGPAAASSSRRTARWSTTRTRSDPWRWTHAGLERLFAANGDWRSVTVSPGSGTASCSRDAERDLPRTRAAPDAAAPVRGPAVSVLNRIARWLDRRSPTLRARDPARSPGTTTSSRSDPRESRPPAAHGPTRWWPPGRQSRPPAWCGHS